MRTSILMGMTALCFHFPAAQALAPAPSPNFCTHGLCLEIAQLTSKAVEVETRTKNSRSEVVIRNAAGITKIFYSINTDSACRNQGDIQLRKIGRKYSGNGCVGLPDENAKWRYITFEYTPLNVGATEVARLGIPVLNIWGIDSSPLSFWGSGYALRVGESIRIKWQGHQ